MTYDMQYLAVAEAEDCELWTASERLFYSLKGKTSRVRLVGATSDHASARRSQTPEAQGNAGEDFPGLWQKL